MLLANAHSSGGFAWSSTYHMTTSASYESRARSRVGSRARFCSFTISGENLLAHCCHCIVRMMGKRMMEDNKKGEHLLGTNGAKNLPASPCQGRHCLQSESVRLTYLSMGTSHRCSVKQRFPALYYTWAV